jgi:septal ring factor EnvC (AmiA/AmiB activator)
MDIQKTVNEFKALWDHERQLRRQLETIADDIKYAEKEFTEIDKGVTYGSKFPQDLMTAEDGIKQLKARRNEISNELQQAIAAVHEFRVKNHPALREAMLELYANVETAQRNLEECVQELSQAGRAIDTSHFGGFGFSFIGVNSQLVAGHTITITERDVQYFTRLKGAKEWTLK